MAPIDRILDPPRGGECVESEPGLMPRGVLIGWCERRPCAQDQSASIDAVDRCSPH